jgi:hypothetical protein
VAVIATPDQQIMPAATSEDVNLVLSRLLGSKYFVHAPKKQKFLRLVCNFYLNGRAGELNEYLIGREVFDRDGAYNPAADPIVRVGAHDVRKKLELYYKREGADDEIRLDIPIGSYEPIFIRTHKATPVPEPSDQESIDPSAQQPSSLDTRTIETGASGVVVSSPENIISNLNKRLRVLYSLIGALVITVSLLAYPHIWPRQQVSGAISTNDFSNLGPVWESFMRGDDSILLVLSNPLVYRLMNAGDTEISVKNSIELPADKASDIEQLLSDDFALRNSPPNRRLVPSIDTYTGLGEAIGVQHVTDLLRTAGKSVSVKRSRTVTAEDMKEHHVVLFGSVWANEWSGKLPMADGFQITGQATIKNINPQPGEEREYRSRFDNSTGKLLEDYALVTIKPNISSSNIVMILAGLRSAGTEAAAEFVTSKNHLNELNQRLMNLSGNHARPSSFQALLKVGVENGIPMTISLISLRELGAQ